MNYKLKNNGFSLTEVLFALGTIAVGTVFIAGVFPVGLYFSTVATERTIAAVTADEAFAKIKLYGNTNPNLLSSLPLTNTCVDFKDVVAIAPFNFPPVEFAYPSDLDLKTQKQYYWSALCRRINTANQLVQVTVFVSRKRGNASTYAGFNWPVPVQVGVSPVPGPGSENKLTINTSGQKTFINDGYTIVDNATGQIYRVMKRYADDPGTAIHEDQMILLDRPWKGTGPLGSVWVIPPADAGGRCPCIAVYQKIIRF